MEYKIIFSSDAQKDLKILQKKAPLALPKLAKLLDELREHPRTGTGQVEPLKGCDIDLSSANVLEILLAYRTFRQTLNASYSNDTVITEVRTGGAICRNEHRKWELCTIHTGRRTFISYNVMRCATEAEVRKCSGHKSMKTFERYITFDED